MNLGARGRPRAARHMAYFDLLEALPRPGCPICYLAKRTTYRYLDILSYENVNDPGLRARLRAARGFCRYHAWQFVDDLDDGLGTAIIYRDIVESMLAALAAAGVGSAGANGPSPLLAGLRSAHGSQGHDLVRRLAPRGECPACYQLDLLTRVFVDILLDHLDDPDLSAALARSTGLCLPHLAQALGRARTWEQAERLARTVGQAYARLSPDGLTIAAVLPLLVGEPGAVLVRSPWPPAGPAPAAGAVVPEGGGCLVCRGALAAGDSCLRDLASAEAESVGNLCNAHAARYLALGLAGGDVGARLLAQWADRLLALPSPVASPRRRAAVLAVLGRPASLGLEAAVAWGLASPAACPACLDQAGAEQALSMLVDEREHGALCLSHFLLGLLNAADARAQRSLAAGQSEAYRDIVASLSEFIRKRDYRFTHEPPGEEADSPERAVALVAGARELGGVGQLPGAPRRGQRG